MLLKRLISSEQYLNQTLRDLKSLLDQHGYFNIEVKQGQRSLNQNALYWEWVSLICPYINEKWKLEQTKENTHDLLRHLHLGYRSIPQMGRTEIPAQLKSTKDLTTTEMFHYMSQVDAWCAKLGLLLPHPEDSEYAKYKEANQ